MLEIKNLIVSINDNEILRGVNLTIQSWNVDNLHLLLETNILNKGNA